MTETEIVNKIIAEMNQGQHHRFFDIWSRVTGNPIGGEVWRKERKKIFTLMINKGLIRHIREADNDAIVELRDRGLKIKNEGGLKVDISKIAGGVFKFSKLIWIFLIGFFTIFSGAVIFYDRVLKGGTDEQPKTQPQTDSTTIKKQQIPLIIEDTSKLKPAVDSLDKN